MDALQLFNLYLARRIVLLNSPTSFDGFPSLEAYRVTMRDRYRKLAAIDLKLSRQLNFVFYDASSVLQRRAENYRCLAESVSSMTTDQLDERMLPFVHLH